MSNTNGSAKWEPKFGIPGGGARPASTLSPYMAKLREGLAHFAHKTRLDAWVNEVTGFGTTRDKSTYGYILPNRILTDDELSNLYHSDDMAARMVDVVPQEMLREPFDVETGDPDLDAAIADKMDELSVREKFADGIRWARAFGGGACLIGCDDGREANEELKPQRAEDIKYLYPIDRRYLWPISYYSDFGHPKLGQPKTFLVTTSGQSFSNTMEVHESRLVLFYGAHTANREKLQTRGWTYSVMQRAYAILRQFNTGWASVETLLTDASQSVYAISGLSEMLAAGGEAMVQQRMRALDLYRSVIRAIVVDADRQETFTRQATSFTQIPDTLDKFMLRLAASVEIPVTILMGQSPAGMNATGESDFRWFYDRIRAKQTTELTPRIRRLVAIWLMTKRGRTFVKKKPETITVKFPPLWTETPLAQAQREKAIADTDKVYIDAQVYTPEEVALIRGRADGFNGPIQLTPEGVDMRERAIAAQTKGEALTPEELAAAEKAIDGAAATPGEEMPDGKAGDVAEGTKLELTATDLATITRVNEARKASGLAPLASPEGDMFIPEFKAKFAETIAAAALAEQGQDPDAPKPAAPSPFGGPPKGSQSALAPDKGEGPPDGEKPAEGEDGAANGKEDEEDANPFKTGKLPESFRKDARPRTFTLQRDIDESGVSGTGEVATGCVFDDGSVAMRWRTETAATTLFASIEHVLKVHGHGGKTRIIWDE